MGRDGEVILSLRTLRRLGAIPDEWPKIDERKSSEWDDDLYGDFEAEFEEEVNEVNAEPLTEHDKACNAMRDRLIQKHPKVFTDELNGNTMKIEPVSVKFKPDAKKPRVAYTAREPPVHWRPAAKKLIQLSLIHISEPTRRS